MKEVSIMRKKEIHGKVEDGETEGEIVLSKDQGLTNSMALQKDSDRVMQAMMELMTGVNDSLQEVAGGMRELQQEHEENPPDREAFKAVHHGPKDRMLDLPMGSSKNPRQGLAELRAKHKEWYTVAKGKDGACNVFDNYKEAKGLVYRVSGAIWKHFKT